MEPSLDRYRPWFHAAAVYNVVWATFVVLWPHALFDWLGMPRLNYPAMVQCIGMMVGVYAIGYWLIARDPVRFGPLVYVGLAGKVLGIVGTIWAASTGELPWRFLWVNAANDLIWIPAFLAFVVALRRHERLAT